MQREMVLRLLLTERANHDPRLAQQDLRYPQYNPPHRGGVSSATEALIDRSVDLECKDGTTLDI